MESWCAEGGREGGRPAAGTARRGATWAGQQGAACLPVLCSEACRAALSLCPDHSSRFWRPTLKSCQPGAASEEARRRAVTCCPPSARNLSQQSLRRDWPAGDWDAGSREAAAAWTGSTHPGHVTLSKSLPLPEPHCSSSGEWVSNPAPISVHVWGATFNVSLTYVHLKRVIVNESLQHLKGRELQFFTKCVKMAHFWPGC